MSPKEALAHDIDEVIKILQDDGLYTDIAAAKIKELELTIKNTFKIFD